jgi:hypothetical protein
MKIMAVLALAVGFAFAQKSQPKTSLPPPTKNDVEAALKRTFGYDPSVTWVIYDIRGR